MSDPEDQKFSALSELIILKTGELSEQMKNFMSAVDKQFELVSTKGSDENSAIEKKINKIGDRLEVIEESMKILLDKQ
jgi:hypothetical protein